MILYDIPVWAMLPWLFVLGAVLGSFLNVCIHRIPEHRTLSRQLRAIYSPPSRCPRCFHAILRRDNVPIVGWLLLRGRCRFCRAPISIRYPLIELFNGLLFVLVYWYEIPFSWTESLLDSPFHTDLALPGSEFWNDDAVLHWRYAFHMILIESLLAATLIDFATMEIPSATTDLAIIAGVLIAFAVPQVHLVPVWFTDPQQIASLGILLPESLRGLLAPDVLGATRDGPHVPAWIAAWPHLHGLVASLAGMIVGGGTVWAVRIIGGWALKKEAMGFGDVMLMALVGTYLGWQASLVVFFLAPLAALAVVAATMLVRLRREIPYGPYLSLAALMLIFGWPRLWPHAERIFEMGLFVPALGIVGGALLGILLQVTRGVERLLGIEGGPPGQTEGQWTSADTLHYLSSENIDTRRALYRPDGWAGTSAARGTLHGHAWRHGAAPPRHPANLFSAPHRRRT